MTAPAAVLRTFRIQVTTPNGVGEMDVPAFSEDFAKRRAYWTAASIGWGDLDELEVTNCVEVTSP